MITWLDYKPSPRRLSICLSQREQQNIVAQSVTPKYHHWVSWFYFLFKCWNVLNLLCFFSKQINYLNELQTIIKLWIYCLWETVLSKRIRDSQHILNIESPALAQLAQFHTIKWSCRTESYLQKWVPQCTFAQFGSIQLNLAPCALLSTIWTSLAHR
jgi:hypothetical protein